MGCCFVFNSIITLKDNLIWLLTCFNVYTLAKFIDDRFIYIYIYKETGLCVKKPIDHILISTTL